MASVEFPTGPAANCENCGRRTRGRAKGYGAEAICCPDCRFNAHNVLISKIRKREEEHNLLTQTVPMRLWTAENGVWYLQVGRLLRLTVELRTYGGPGYRAAINGDSIMYREHDDGLFPDLNRGMAACMTMARRYLSECEADLKTAAMQD